MQHRLHAARYVADLQRAAVQLHHLLDKVEPQARTFAPAGRARQRVEALAQARQGVIGNRLRLVEQADLHLVMPHLRAEPQRAAGRGEIQSIVEQVTQGLA